jgi:hypothetical protein
MSLGTCLLETEIHTILLVQMKQIFSIGEWDICVCPFKQVSSDLGVYSPKTCWFVTVICYYKLVLQFKSILSSVLFFMNLHWISYNK